MVSLFNSISALGAIFNAKVILVEEQYWCCLAQSYKDYKGVNTFPKGTNLKNKHNSTNGV